jgi:hypothetical protein
MEPTRADHGHSFRENEGARPPYTEYRTRISEKDLEYADLTDSGIGTRFVRTGNGLGPKNTIHI